MTMAIIDLIESSTKCRAVLVGREQRKHHRRKAMSSGRSVLNTGAPSGIGAGSADCFVRRGYAYPWHSEREQRFNDDSGRPGKNKRTSKMRSVWQNGVKSVAASSANCRTV